MRSSDMRATRRRGALVSGSMPAVCEDRKRERTRAFTGLLSRYLFVDRFGRPG